MLYLPKFIRPKTELTATIPALPCLGKTCLFVV
jgi:hypothetical protein